MSTITSYYFDREIDKMSSFDFPSYTKRIKLKRSDCRIPGPAINMWNCQIVSPESVSLKSYRQTSIAPNWPRYKTMKSAYCFQMVQFILA